MTHSSQLKDKKIIFVLGYLKIGGSEQQALRLAQFLKNECKADVEIWALSREVGKLARLCEFAGIPWRGVRFYWPLRRRFWPFRALVRWVSLSVFAFNLRRAKPHILISYTWLPNIVCGWVWRFVGAHLSIWNQRDGGYFLKQSWVHRLAVRATTCFISNSHHGKKFLCDVYGCDPNQIQVIRNGVALQVARDDRGTWRNRLRLEGGQLAVCMVANLHRYKDHYTLLRTWREVLDQWGKRNLPPVLILAGRFDCGKAELRTLLKELQLGEGVQLLGEVEDISGLLRAVDLYVHSSRNEGCPNGVLEAMAAGLAVVGTDIPGIREALGESGIRFLAPIGNAQVLAAKLMELMDHRELRHQVGEENRRRIEKEFSLEKMCGKTLEILWGHLPS